MEVRRKQPGNFGPDETHIYTDHSEIGIKRRIYLIPSAPNSDHPPGGIVLGVAIKRSDKEGWKQHGILLSKQEVYQFLAEMLRMNSGVSWEKQDDEAAIPGDS